MIVQTYVSGKGPVLLQKYRGDQVVEQECGKDLLVGETREDTSCVGALIENRCSTIVGKIYFV